MYELHIDEKDNARISSYFDEIQPLYHRVSRLFQSLSVLMCYDPCQLLLSTLTHLASVSDSASAVSSKGQNAHCHALCHVTIMQGGQKQPHVWNSRPQVAYLLYNFLYLGPHQCPCQMASHYVQWL